MLLVVIDYAKDLKHINELSLFVYLKQEYQDAIIRSNIPSYLMKRTSIVHNNFDFVFEIAFSCRTLLRESLLKHNLTYNRNAWDISYDKFRHIIEPRQVESIALRQNYNNLINPQKEDDFKIINLNDNSSLSNESFNSNNLDINLLNGIEFKTEPRAYQKQGILYMLNNPKCLNADDMGLGKSLQTINTALLNKCGKHCLVIVGFDALQFNWVAEIEKHSNEKAHVLGQKTKRNGRVVKGTLKERYEDLQNIDKIEEYFIITNITTLRSMKKVKSKIGKFERTVDTYIFAELLEEYCRKGIIGRIVFDEIQMCKNSTSSNGKSLLMLRSCPNKIALTGTPIMNNHIDLYSILSWLDIVKMNYWTFRDMFCEVKTEYVPIKSKGDYLRDATGKVQTRKVQTISGNKNSAQLRHLLQKCMIRRKKTEVTDLPKKNYIDEILEMDLKQEGLYNTTAKLTEIKIEELKLKYGSAYINKGLLASSLVSLRKVTCNPCLIDAEQYPDNSVKFDRTKQLLEQIVENGEKAVIFCTWAEPLKILFDEFKDYNPAMIIGATKDRMLEVEKFQNDETCKVILGTIGAMGTGLTLTAGSNIIFLDEPWNRALKDQAVDRCNRICATKVTNIYTLMCKDTIDLIVHKIVTSKGKVQDFLVDGKTDTTTDDKGLTALQKAIKKIIEEGE